MSVRLFIGNLPFSATEADLRDYFSAVGPPQQVVLPVDRDTGRPRGFAFVEFAERPVAEEAIRRFDRQMFKGRPLAVSEARGRDERPAPSGPRPGGFAPRPGPDLAPGGAPATRDRSRNFGPDARPRRGGGPPRRQQTERGPKGPIREKAGGRVYSVDEDDQDESLELGELVAEPDGLDGPEGLDGPDLPDDDSDE